MKVNPKYLTREEFALVKGKTNFITHLRKYGYQIEMSTKEIICEHKSLEDFPTGPRYYAGKLLKLGFIIQLKAL